MWLLKLSSSCLRFDFIGTLTDESADDFAVVQIPTTWRSVFLDFSTLQLYFDLYHHLPANLAALVCPITCLSVCVLSHVLMYHFPTGVCKCVWCTHWQEANAMSCMADLMGLWVHSHL